MATYTALRAKYANGIPCPPDFSFPSHVVDKWALDPSLIAIHWVDYDYSSERKISYKELSELSHRSALAFAARGIVKGDRIMVQTPRICEWWITILGLLRIGAVPIPGTSLLMAKDLKFRAQSANATAFVGDADACERFEAIAASVGIDRIFQVRTKRDGGLGNGRIDFQEAIGNIGVGSIYKGQPIKSTDLSIMFFTSGTTGNPKQVLMENEYLLGQTITGEWYRLAPHKLFCNMADLGWAKASYSTFGALNLGATLFVQPPPPGPFSPLHLLESLNRYPITTLCCPPTIYRSLITESAAKFYRANPPLALEHCVGAGEPLNAQVIKEWRILSGGIDVCDGWGQSETVLVVGNYRGEAIRPGSMGKASPGFQIGVIGQHGEELAIGEEGELAIRTDVGGGRNWIFKGYVKDGKIDTRRKAYGGKEWYGTGDRGFKDVDEYFWFVGRDDDVITTGGYRVGPFEVESALKEHPAVFESAAVASPDAVRHEIVKAYIILTDESQAKLQAHGANRAKEEARLIVEIQDFVKANAASYKYPREIEFVDTLPKTVSGKIRRIELRDEEYRRKADIAKALRAKL